MENYNIPVFVPCNRSIYKSYISTNEFKFRPIQIKQSKCCNVISYALQWYHILLFLIFACVKIKENVNN